VKVVERDDSHAHGLTYIGLRGRSQELEAVTRGYLALLPPVRDEIGNRFDELEVATVVRALCIRVDDEIVDAAAADVDVRSLARISHQCPKRGRADAGKDKARDSSSAEAYLTVRAPFAERTALQFAQQTARALEPSATQDFPADARPQPGAGEKCGLGDHLLDAFADRDGSLAREGRTGSGERNAGR
jgi:hypothetical protein